MSWNLEAKVEDLELSMSKGTPPNVQTLLDEEDGADAHQYDW